jgi:hypothetical protein
MKYYLPLMEFILIIISIFKYHFLPHSGPFKYHMPTTTPSGHKVVVLFMTQHLVATKWAFEILHMVSTYDGNLKQFLALIGYHARCYPPFMELIFILSQL